MSVFKWTLAVVGICFIEPIFLVSASPYAVLPFFVHALVDVKYLLKMLNMASMRYQRQ